MKVLAPKLFHNEVTIQVCNLYICEQFITSVTHIQIRDPAHPIQHTSV